MCDWCLSACLAHLDVFLCLRDMRSSTRRTYTSIDTNMGDNIDTNIDTNT